MISVEEALKHIVNNVSSLNAITIPLTSALGYALAKDIHSPIHMPPFDNSAMDGYAIHEWESNRYTVVDEIQAGMDASQIVLKPGEAARIFTGAMVPNSASTVVKQEITERDENVVTIIEAFKSGSNIRRKAEQITEGDLALAKGSILDAAGIGFLAMLGITEVTVHRKPEVKILVTGNELVDPGSMLAPGQIYESNATTLISALNEAGCSAEAVRVQDDYEATREKVGQLVNECDLLLTSGGISVGDYDFVWKAMQQNGVKPHFYKVKQKPGKPLFYGSTDNCHVFALPGNPASALTCFYIYVLPALRIMMGYETLSLEKRQLIAANDISKKAGLTHFLKGFASHDKVQSLEHQSSSMLNSFAKANCLIVLPEELENISEGTLISAYMLP